MGLYKTIRDDFGIEASYWNIGQMIIDENKNIINIKINGYKDKESKNNLESPISIIPMTISYKPFRKFIDEDFNIKSKEFKEYCYIEFIKKLEIFKNSSDAFEEEGDNNG